MRKYWWILPFVIVLVAWIAYQYWLPQLQVTLDRKSDLAGAGSFGDSYGALNTLFSGLAFAGIIISIILQSQELRDTREELRGQKNQLGRQAFENTFFQLLRLQNEIVSAFKYTSYISGRSFSGHDCFDAIKSDLESYLKNPHAGDALEQRYEKFYLNHAHWNLGHYFRNLYQVIKYVHNSDVETKKFYTNIVRAQLSSDELFLLFWNALSIFGRDKFQPLVISYQLLEHLPQRGEIERADALRFGSGAFGDSAEWKRLIGTGP